MDVVRKHEKNQKHNMKTMKIKYWTDIPKKYSGIAKYEFGDINYLLNGKYHRLDGPAYIRNNGYKVYYINGKIICSSIDKDYEQKFYNSKQYKKAKQQEDLFNNLLKINSII